MAVPIQPAAEQPKKSVQELENPEVKGRILIQNEFSWITPEIAERLTRPIKWGYKRPEVSGFKMARLVCLLTFLSLSCSYNLSPTTAQKEQKKFERFKIAPKEAIILSGAAFIGYGTGKHFARIKD